MCDGDGEAVGGWSVGGSFCIKVWEPKSCCLPGLARAAVGESRRSCQQIRGSLVGPLPKANCEDGKPEHLVICGGDACVSFVKGG